MSGRRRSVLTTIALVALVVVATTATTATAAAKGHKVLIETDPAGADVYLGDQEAGSAGQTPLELTLADGEYVVILELAGHVPRFESIVVEKRTGKAAKTAQAFAFTLDPSTATLIVALADGATLPEGSHVLVDGEDRGEVPIRIDVEVGAHQVQLISPGRDPYEEWVEVEGGEEHVLTVSGASLGDVQVVAPKPKAKRKGEVAPLGTVRSGVEFGWRRFRYDSPRTPNLRPYDAGGSMQVVIDAELHPWRRFVGNRVLDRMTLTGGAGLAPSITVRGMGTTIDGYWRTQHAGARFRALAKAKIAVDVDAGWMHLLYTFRDLNNNPVDEVPDVDYHMIRVGARVVGRFRPQLDGWFGLDNRLVVSGGPLEDRFRSAEIDGVAVKAGAAAWFLERHLEGRVEATLARYGWTFQSEDGDDFDADGGSDILYGVTLSVGGSY